MIPTALLDRRNFIKATAAMTTGFIGLGNLQQTTAGILPEKEGVYVIGPVEGYSLHIGTLVSMLNYNRHTILSIAKPAIIYNQPFCTL